jgi:CRISPR/Cas system-associated endoribonuclease Cas2
VVVVYDIGNDQRRAHIRAALEPVADRFQQSGWLVPAFMGLTAHDIGHQLGTLAQGGDRIRAYAPCPACVRLARWLPVRQPHSLVTVHGWVV